MSSTMERRNTTTHMMAERMEHEDTLQAVGAYLLRYGLAFVIAWIGFMKFTAYEAAGIEPLVANSPLMIALRAVSPKVCAIGSALAIGMFFTTLTFLLSTPGWEASLGGFPALSVVPGQFILKDIVLLGAAVWSLGEALPHARA
jgi:uncharacterized membrane protein YkgB